VKRVKLISIISLVVLIFQALFVPSSSLAGTYNPDLRETDNVLHSTRLFPEKVINDFNSPEDVSTWQAGENTKEINYVTSLLNGPNNVYEGSGSLEQIPTEAKVYEWRTIYRQFDEPLDLSNQNYLSLAADSWGWRSADYLLRIRLYSHNDFYEGIASIQANQWNKVFLDIKPWEKRNEITKIEISFMHNFDLEGVNPGDPGYDYWSGRFQLDYISATNIVDMEFSGDTEGFTAQNGTLEASRNSLIMSVTDENPVIQSPPFSLELGKRNTLSTKMKNNTDAEKVKISWITNEDENWDNRKSKVFDISPNSDSAVYDFNFSDNPNWTGTLKQFKIEPVVNNSNGSIEIDHINFKISEDIKKDYVGKVAASKINGQGNIQISGTIKSEFMAENQNEKLLLYELATYEHEEKSLQNHNPIAQKNISDSFSFEIELKEENHNRLHSKFVVAIKGEEGNYEIVDNAKYITNPEAIANNDYSFPKARSIKGLQVYAAGTGDSEELGISHAGVNVPYDSLLYETNSQPENTILYQFEGEDFYFKKNVVKNLDNRIKSLSDNNTLVTLILIMYNRMHPESPNEHIIHPDSQPGGTVYAFNTTNKIGVKYYKAITNFIAERYTRPDQKYGRAANFIVGNEIGQNKIWNNMGPKLIGEYVKDYARTLRLTNTIVKSNYKNGRVYISLDHFWDQNLPPDSMWKYDNKEIVDRLTQHINKEGNIPWNVAFHPYPENLFDPKFWEDESAADDFNTDRITFKNLKVLVNYMKKPDYLYDGKMRRIILSEQGFDSGDNSLESQKLQAAAYAYAFYKIKFLDGIDSFILHRHVDHAKEGGLHLGLWTNKPGEVEVPDKQKYIYDVFKYIDTKRSLQVTEFAKEIIGIEKWSDVIPNFDPSELTDRKLPTLVGTSYAKKSLNPFVIEDFDEGTGNWERADNANSIGQNQQDLYKGEGALEVNFNSISKLWKGSDVKFDKSIDASSTPYLNLALKLPEYKKSNQYYAKVKVYDGVNYAEGIIALEPAQGWHNISLNLKKWGGIKSIDRIKVWVRSTTTENWAGSFLIDEVNFSERVVPQGGITNLDITSLNNEDHLQPGAKLKLKVRNYDNVDLQGEITIQPSDHIEFSQDALKVNDIGPGESKIYELTVTEYTPPTEGQVFTEFNYREKTIKRVLQVIKDTGEQDLPENTALLYNFEGDLQGWKAGENIESIKSVESFPNAPQTPKLGSSALSARSESIPATDWRTVYVNLDEPMNLEDASSFFYHLDSYGGVPDAEYESKVTLYSETQSISKVLSVNPNTWNRVALDISDWEFKDGVTKIEISFRAVGNDMSWNPELQVDFIGYKKKQK
jgi:hypothetical protein